MTSQEAGNPILRHSREGGDPVPIPLSFLFLNLRMRPNKSTALMRITRFDAKKVMMNDNGSVRWYDNTRR